AGVRAASDHGHGCGRVLSGPRDDRRGAARGLAAVAEVNPKSDAEGEALRQIRMKSQIPIPKFRTRSRTPPPLAASRNSTDSLTFREAASGPSPFCDFGTLDLGFHSDLAQSFAFGVGLRISDLPPHGH